MNNSWVLKLYPEHWRARYEPEFRALLEDAPMSVMDIFDIAFGAIDAHLRPQQALGSAGSGGAPPLMDAPDPDDAIRRRVRQIKYHVMHLIAVAVLSVLLVGINLLTTPGFLWALFPIWAMAMPLALHTMVLYKWRSWFGAVAVPLLVFNVGMIGINIWANPSMPWSVWTLSLSAVPVIGTGLVTFGITTPLRAVAISEGLIAALLAVACILKPDLIGQSLFQVGIVISILFAVQRMRTRQWSLFAAHGFVFVAVNAMAFTLNLAQHPDTFWFQYVLAASSLLLAVHAMVRYGLIEFYDSSWEDAKIAQLTARIRESAVTDAVQRRIFLTARIQRSFWMHVFFAVVAALDLTIINLLSGTDTPWLLWPVGVWAVALLTHAGYAFGPNRLLSAHLVFWISTSAGLIAIDIWEASERWWHWPVAAYAIVLALHAGWVFVRPRWFGAMLGAVVAGIAFLVMADLSTPGATWWYWPVLGLVAAVLLAAPFAFNVMRRVAEWEARKISAMTRD
jgi:hypothetical protein